MNCYRTSNNKYFTVPPRMADGRHFTEYRENTKVNELLGLDSNTKNSYEYRQFLIKNGVSLMNKNKKQLYGTQFRSESKLVNGEWLGAYFSGKSHLQVPF